MDINISPAGVAPANRPVRDELTDKQLRYIQLKLTSKLNNVQMAEQVGVHFNTITNWNKTPMVQNAIAEQLESVRKDNMIGMSRLMASIIREAEQMLGDDGVGVTLKMQLIGQLFAQAGKFAGLEPVKAVEKKVTVVKSIEQMINCEEVIDVDAE